MKSRSSFWPLLVAVALLVGQMPASSALAMQAAQTGSQLRTAYERGYVAGYTDGYRAGKDDYTNQFSRNFRQHLLYIEANRGYQSRFGAYSDFQSGYRLGFEVAYSDGYSGRTFNSRIPSNVSRTARNRDTTEGLAEGRRASGAAIVPDGMSLRIRLEMQLTTKTNHQEDPFDARVVEPREYQGAIIQGHIARIERAGKITGRTLMALEFDTIILPNGGQGSFHAQILNVYATDAVQSVDEEGNVVSASKTTETEIRSIGGAVLGAIIGGLASGGTGIAIGAILGAGAGAGSVYVQGDKDLILNAGTQMMVRVSNPTRY
jgi:hypothetical protein